MTSTTATEVDSPSLYAQLMAGAWFAALPEGVRDQIAQRVTVRELANEDTVYSQGDPPAGLFCVLTGQIKTIGIADDGQPTFLSLLRAGEWTGFLSQIDRQPYPFSTHALGPTRIAILPDAACQAIFGQSVGAMQAVAIPLANICRFAFDYLISTNGRPPKRIVAQRLIDLSRCLYIPGAPMAGAVERVNQEDIAAATYLTRPTVNRILRELNAEGLIKSKYGAVELLDVPALDAIATGQASGAMDNPTEPPTPKPWRNPDNLEEVQFIRDGLMQGPWFSALPADVQDQVVNAVRVLDCEPGDTVVNQGEDCPGLHAIVDGQVNAIGYAADGIETLTSIFRAGDWSGFVPMIDGGKEVFTLAATRKTKAVLINKADAIRIFESSSLPLYRSLVAPMLLMMREIYDYLIEANRRTPRRLVARRLFDLSRCPFIAGAPVMPLVEDLTQEDLARATGLSRPSVSGILHELAGEKIVKVGYSNISILRPDALFAASRTSVT